jgi:hypothetical protein
MRGTSAIAEGYSGLPGRLGIGDHLPNRLYAGDGLFGEGKPKRDRSQQFAIDVNRAAAHALHNAGLFEGTTGELGEDDGLLWSEVFEDTEDLDLELFDLISTENGAADTALTGTDIFERKERLSEDRQREHDEQGEEAAREPSAFKSRAGGQLTHISHCSEGWFAIAL